MGAPQLPHGWVAHRDEQTGQIYYCYENGHCQWEVPEQHGGVMSAPDDETAAYTAQKLQEPQIRIPRTFKRFCGLTTQLLFKLSIRASNGPHKLLKVIKNPVTDHLPPGAKIHLLSVTGDLTHMPDWVAKNCPKTVKGDALKDPVVFVAGAMAHGKVEPEYDVDSCLAHSFLPKPSTEDGAESKFLFLTSPSPRPSIRSSPSSSCPRLTPSPRPSLSGKRSPPRSTSTRSSLCTRPSRATPTSRRGGKTLSTKSVSESFTTSSRSAPASPSSSPTPASRSTLSRAPPSPTPSC